MTPLRLLLPLVWLAGGCAQRVNPDEMSAARHRREAAKEEQVADQHGRRFDPHATANDPEAPGASGIIAVPRIVYNPTQWHLKEAVQHSKHAHDHEAAAAALEKFEAVECRAFAPRARATCPFFGPIHEVQPIDDGVRLVLDEGTPTAELVAHIRCHLAYARAQGWEIPSCPLMVRGVDATLLPDGRSIELRSTERRVVRELQKRSAEVGGGAGH